MEEYILAIDIRIGVPELYCLIKMDNYVICNKENLNNIFHIQDG